MFTAVNATQKRLIFMIEDTFKKITEEYSNISAEAMYDWSEK